MLVNVSTICSAAPTRPLTTMELVNAIRNVTGKKFTINIDAGATIQQLCDACDAQMIVDPSRTTNEIIMEGDKVLDKNLTLAAAGVADGDNLVYKFYLRID